MRSDRPRPTATLDEVTQAGAEMYQTVVPHTVGQLRILRVSGVELDLDGIRVRIDGVPSPLPMKEFQVLRALMENAGKVVTRRQMLDAAWGEGYPDQNKTLEVHILRLRKRLNAQPDGQPRLRTVRGVGYVFDILGA